MPIFIYQQSVIIIVQLVNLLLLLHTGIIVMSVTNPASKEGSRQQFLRFVKIFCLLGFTWIAELISTALEVEHGYQETFYVRLFLDLVNLFLGVLLFVCLVCTEQVYLLTRARLLGRSISQQEDQDEINVRHQTPPSPLVIIFRK